MTADKQSLESQRLPKRHFFIRHAGAYYGSSFNFLDDWRSKWKLTSRSAQFTTTPDITLPTDTNLQRKAWITLNCLQVCSWKIKTPIVSLNSAVISILQEWHTRPKCPPCSFQLPHLWTISTTGSRYD